MLERATQRQMSVDYDIVVDYEMDCENGETVRWFVCGNDWRRWSCVAWRVLSGTARSIEPRPAERPVPDWHATAFQQLCHGPPTSTTIVRAHQCPSPSICGVGIRCHWRSAVRIRHRYRHRIWPIELCTTLKIHVYVYALRVLMTEWHWHLAVRDTHTYNHTHTHTHTHTHATPISWLSWTNLQVSNKDTIWEKRM